MAADLPTAVDWIVVGGGAAGCTAAAALADANENVLVIERGLSDKHIPSTQSGHTWAEVVAEAVEDIQWEDGAWGGVAKVLGGGASVNDGYFFEETPEFLTEHLQLVGPDADDFYSSSRWLADQLLQALPPTEYGLRYAEAVNQAGHGMPDFHDVSNVRYKDGAWVVRSLFNLSSPSWNRNTPAQLLHKRESLSNLHVATEALVTKIHFEGKRATSVSVLESKPHAKSKVIAASKGIILSAGAIYTPQLLQVSGIGEAAHLQQLGVAQVVDLPVGHNFIDRLTWVVQIIARKKLDKYLGYTVAADTAAGLTFESVGGVGIDTYMAIPSLALAPTKNRYEFLRPLIKFIVKDTPVGEMINRFSNILALIQDPESRGFVLANSTDVRKPPRVAANFFSADADLKKQIANLKALLDIAKSSALDDWRLDDQQDQIESVWPKGTLNASQKDVLSRAGLETNGPNGMPDFLTGLLRCDAYGFVSVPCPPSDESKWGQFLKDNVLSTYHYFGTAAVGSVLEPGSFAVKGTEGLYVADASAIPQATRINPVGTIMSLGHYVGRRLAKNQPARTPLSPVPHRAPPSDNVHNDDVFLGEYTCRSGVFGLRLTMVTWPSAAELEIFPSASSPLGRSCSGRHISAGSWEPLSRTLMFTPGHWIQNPCNLTASSLFGIVATDGSTFNGSVGGLDCWRFWATRDQTIYV